MIILIIVVLYCKEQIILVRFLSSCLTLFLHPNPHIQWPWQPTSHFNFIYSSVGPRLSYWIWISPLLYNQIVKTLLEDLIARKPIWDQESTRWMHHRDPLYSFPCLGKNLSNSIHSAWSQVLCKLKKVSSTNLI